MFGGTNGNRQSKNARFRPVETIEKLQTESFDKPIEDEFVQAAYQLTPQLTKEQVGVLFQPVYKRMGHSFLPCSYKALSVVNSEETPVIMGRPLVATEGMSLVRAMKLGYHQHELIDLQLSAFARQVRGLEKVSLELDIYDLATNPAHFDNVISMIAKSEERGVSAKQINVELNASAAIDLPVLADVALRLKSLGVNITLTNMDADNFSVTRIFRVQPTTIKFNRSWIEAGQNNKDFQTMFRSIVDTLHNTGHHAALTNVESKADVAFANTCGLIRCQGSHFGLPASNLMREQVYTV